MRGASAGGPLAGLALLVLGSAAAGGQPCVLDKCLDPAPPGAEAPVTRAPAALPPRDFDFYVLALSWSPGFCEAGGASRSPAQCAPGRGLGFVVHGLWPQYTRGYPADCGGPTPNAPRAAVEAVRDLYPDPGLARHEWRKHGTCTGLSPTSYFAAVRQARGSIAIPPALTSPQGEQSFAPADIARAFTAANRGLRADTMAVTCKGGALQEVRLCLSKDLRAFVSCPEVARGACRDSTVTVAAPR